MTEPDLVATIYAFESAMFFFNKNNLWKICDVGLDKYTITKLSKMINGGTNGLNERLTLTTKYSQMI